MEPERCAYCQATIDGEVEWTIHRDGFGEGPEVPLCSKCADADEPTCEQIWARISRRFS